MLGCLEIHLYVFFGATYFLQQYVVHVTRELTNRIEAIDVSMLNVLGVEHWNVQPRTSARPNVSVIL